MDPVPGPPLTHYTRLSPSYHLFSVTVAVAWSLFIVITLITHEVAHRAMWNPNRLATHTGLPWIFSVLPSILRTVFDQGHGPITAMHLARLAVGSLDTPWASPNTWMEVFWLADRRWAGPFGLWMTFKTLVSRKLHKLGGPQVSLGFWLFAALSIVALVTPVTLSRAYHVTTCEVERQIMVSGVSMVDLDALESVGDRSRKLRRQMVYGNDAWSRGMAPRLQYPDNIYAEVGVQITSNGGTWFITGSTNKTIMSLAGIRVAGGCEFVQPNNKTFRDLCGAAFGYEHSSTINHVTSEMGDASACSDISLVTEFGRELRSNASSLFLMTMPVEDYTFETLVHCGISAAAGNASVDGRTMTFRDFTYIAPSESTKAGPQSRYLDPLAAVMQGDPNAYIAALEYKIFNDNMNRGNGRFNNSVWEAELMWEGVVAMSTAVWLSTIVPVDRHGIQKLTATGIRRDNGYVCLLGALLCIWFVGMFASSAVMMRPTWASSLDGYAVARLLQQQPVLAVTPETWLAELEENEDMLQEFVMHKWRDSD